jgi:formylglycine-generating enzyme required for sulfatase activity
MAHPADRVPPALAQFGYAERSVGRVLLILPPLRPIPAGRFLMGSDRARDPAAIADEELPQHVVSLPAFEIGRFPVTVAEYTCAVAVGVVPAPQISPFMGDLPWPVQAQRLDHPVVGVSWDNAVAYAGWLAQLTQRPFRLPTEAEWEYAARGADGRLYPWGDTWEAARANIAENSPGTTTTCGRYPAGASPFGVEEVVGNVWEWTGSLFLRYPYRADRDDARASCSDIRTIRGSSWDETAAGARVAARGSIDRFYFARDGGFRLALR